MARPHEQSLGTDLQWSSGLTNFTYTNWLSGQPNNTCGTAQYTGMLGATNAQPGLWVLANDNGFIAHSTVTNKFYGVAEVDHHDQRRAVLDFRHQYARHHQRAFAKTNGCLYANIVDTNYGRTTFIRPPACSRAMSSSMWR